MEGANSLKKVELRSTFSSKLKKFHSNNPLSFLKLQSKVITNLELLISRLAIDSSSDLSLGGYDSIAGEVDCSKLKYKSLFLPGFISPGKMAFYRGKLALSNEFGVKLLCPVEREEIIPDLVLIPGLAFSREGYRLGRGGGYYDRYLENFEGVKVGVAFSFQLMTHLPHEDHDQKLDYIVTEEEVFKIES